MSNSQHSSDANDTDELIVIDTSEIISFDGLPEPQIGPQIHSLAIPGGHLFVRLFI